MTSDPAYESYQYEWIEGEGVEITARDFNGIRGEIFFIPEDACRRLVGDFVSFKTGVTPAEASTALDGLLQRLSEENGDGPVPADSRSPDLDSLKAYIAPYGGDVSEVRFYITTDNGVNHAQAFVQARADDGDWHAVIIDCMGFSPCYHGGKTAFDVRGCKPYFMTKSLATAMPFIDRMRGEYISHYMRKAGFDPAPVVTGAEAVVEEAALMGDHVVVLTSNNAGSRRRYSLLEFTGDDCRWRYFEDTGGVTIREDLPRITYEEARDRTMRLLMDSWDSKLEGIRRWLESASEARTRGKLL